MNRVQSTMARKTRLRMAVVAGFAVASTILGVGVGVAIAAATPGTNSGVTTPFAKNAKGDTFGSDLNILDPAQEPDLIEAYASNGKLGYIKNVDFHPARPANPAAAVAAQNAKAALAAGASHSIPVFSADGITVIGQFIVVDKPLG